MCNEYNGYSNYQTWNVALWLDNDEVSYDTIRKVAVYSDDSAKLAHWLQGYVLEFNPLAMDASMYSDILQHGLDSINYHEIAENILSE